MLKKLPNPKTKDLIPPDMAYTYFEGAERFPLEPENTEYSPVNAWWFSEFAFLAYCHPGFVRMAVKLAGFDGFRCFEGKGTECMVCWNPQVMVVAFRGTELKSSSTLHEIKTDLNTLPVKVETGGKVHSGFREGLEEIWDGLQDFLKQQHVEHPERPLWITGHSLGGALAALCFARMPEATGLYVYGAPRVGDRTFLKTLRGRPVWRIENARDPIPLVPPDVPKLKFNFGDLGELKFLDADGQVLEERPVFVLEDHKVNYREAKEVLDGKLGELKNSLSLSKQGLKTSKRILKEIEKHQKRTLKDWKKQMRKSMKQFGLSVEDHQPIFYAVKTWNALVGETAGLSDEPNPGKEVP